MDIDQHKPYAEMTAAEKATLTENMAIHGNLSLDVGDRLGELLGFEIPHRIFLQALAENNARLDVDTTEMGWLAVEYAEYLESKEG